MSLMLILATERRRRVKAEAEVARLQAELSVLAKLVASPSKTSDVVQYTDEVTSRLQKNDYKLDGEQELVQQIIDNSPNLVYVEDDEGQCVLANKRYKQLLNQRILVHDKYASSTIMSKEWSSYATTSFEESYQLEDGQIHWYHTTQSPLTRNNGSQYLLTFSSDITELKRAYHAAEESGRAKQVLLANMSHEFRTPLHGVMGLVELLKKENLSAEQLDYVEMIYYSTEHLLLIIDDVLNFTKAESGGIKLENISFDLLKTVRKAARSLEFKTAEKGLQLHIHEPAYLLPLVQGDPYRLHQILVNLIGNAVKFTRRGSITITVEPGEIIDSTLPITFNVTDTGIGISADSFDQLFTSFRQADSSIPRLYGGTGLGLAICKSLVELQGGQIGVSSVLNQGSSFYFTIPYKISEQQSLKEMVVSSITDSLKGLTALLVEDNAINQLLAVSMLGQWQMEVEVAQDGRAAVARAFQRRYDLILMDIQMPELDGIEATSRLRRDAGPNQHTPIIAVTADAIRINAESCQTLGFTDFLLKPYSEAALHHLLTKLNSRGPSITTSIKEFQLSSYEADSSDSELYYDFKTLGKLGTEPEFTRKLLELFISEVPTQIQVLQAAVNKEDWLSVSSEAHKLKTVFGNLSIKNVADYLKTLEEMAALQKPTNEMLPLMNTVFIITESFITRFLQDLKNFK
jgi:two-component system aerobic respiration control sensor histidine kinase ArcB